MVESSDCHRAWRLGTRRGAVEWAGESCLWLRCFYGALGGMLLRLADVKRKDKAFYTNAVR